MFGKTALANLRFSRIALSNDGRRYPESQSQVTFWRSKRYRRFEARHVLDDTIHDTVPNCSASL